jgi:integrase
MTSPSEHPRDHDYRNRRKRHFQPAAEAAGLTGARPHDLRHSFASLMHVIAELREAPRTSATESIEGARRPQEPPTTNGREPG